MEYIVRNYYSCGCYTTADVPVISRCEHHNGWVVNRTGHSIIRPRVFAKASNIRICNAEIYDVMDKLKSPVDILFCYADVELFFHARMMTPVGFAKTRSEFFIRLKQTLGDNGVAVLVIDPEDMAYVYYQATLHGFSVDARLVPVKFRPDPIRYGRVVAEKAYKVAIGINTGPLPGFNFNRMDRLFDGLGIKQKCRILDVGCVFLKEIEGVRPTANIIGVIEDGTRYTRMCRPERRV